MPPASSNTATSAQVQAFANQVAVLQTSVDTLSTRVGMLATEVQSLGQQGNAAIAKLTDVVNNLAAKIP